MADAQSRFAAMPPKQKATVVVGILVVILMLYEAMGFFHSSSPGLPVTGATATMGKMSPSPAPHPSAGPAMTSPAPPPPPPQEPKPATAPDAKVDAPALPPQLEQAQEQYLSAISNLQMLKVQREIAETDEAIAAAKLATVTAEKSISDLLTIKPPPPPPPIPTNAYLQKLGGPGGEGLSSASTLTVLSVTMEHNQWHAVIGQQGKLFNVSVGDTLPTDGSSVAGIDQGGVLLEKDGVQKKIPLVASMQ